MQQRYSMTKQELLAIEEIGMLWGQQIMVYTDHKNLMQETESLTSDQVYH